MIKKRVLVTGCGGDIGQSIIKILREIDFVDQIYGCDIHEKHAGVFLCDHFFCISRVDSKNYADELCALIEDNKIDILIPVSEPELRFHSEYAIFDKIRLRIKSITIIIPNRQSLKIGFDKLKTAVFLKNKNLPFPRTCKVESVNTWAFPCILKDIDGSGSKNIFLVKNQFEWDFYSKINSNLIAQEFIEPDEGEYTCGLFRVQSIIRSIIFKRELHDSYSGYGEVINHEGIENLLIQIAKFIDLDGSINIQLRLKNGIPYVFEINPRFSSTVLFRDLFGFKDLLWVIENKIGLPISPYSPPMAGSEFFKGFHEYIKNK